MKNFITGLITAGVVVYVALIYHSTGMLYCAVWIVCFLLLFVRFSFTFFSANFGFLLTKSQKQLPPASK